jgi:hypothetical protein
MLRTTPAPSPPDRTCGRDAAGGGCGGSGCRGGLRGLRRVGRDDRLRRERRRRHDRAGRRSRRERRLRLRRRLSRAPGERLLQQRRDALGALVLHVVDVEARTLAAAAVEALDPLLRLLDVLGVRRDDQERVHPLDRDDAQNARERAGVLVADDLVDLLRDALHVGVLQREDPRRHAGHPVDVERVDRLAQVPQFQLGPRQDQQVARDVGTHRLRVLRERLEQLRHLGGADVFERHDLHREPGRQRARRIAELRGDVAADRCRLRQDLPEVALVDHRRAVHAQQRLERGRQSVARNAARRTDRHLAADVRIDRVRRVENVAQDVADDFTQIGAFEIQDDGTASRSARRRR